MRAPNDSERRLLLTASDFVDAGYQITTDKSEEVWIARFHPDGVAELKYSYEPEAATPGFLQLLISTRLERVPSSEYAAELFREKIDNYANGVAKVGARFVFKGNLQNWCENAYVGFTLAQPNESVVGCLLSFQKDRMVYTILLRGIVLENEEQIETLVYPFLEKGFLWCMNEPIGNS